MCGDGGGGAGAGVLPAAAKLSRTNTARNRILHRSRFRFYRSRETRALAPGAQPRPFLRALRAAPPRRAEALGERGLKAVVLSSPVLTVSVFGGSVRSPVGGVSTFSWFPCFRAPTTDHNSPFLPRLFSRRPRPSRSSLARWRGRPPLRPILCRMFNSALSWHFVRRSNVLCSGLCRLETESNLGTFAAGAFASRLLPLPTPRKLPTEVATDLF